MDDAGTPELGSEAPDFELPDADRQMVRLSSFRGSKNVVVVFYPLAFTGVCQGELCTIRDSIEDFSGDDVVTLAISVDSTAVHKKWADEQGYTFPLLADFGRTARWRGPTGCSRRRSAWPSGAPSSSTSRASSSTRP